MDWRAIVLAAAAVMIVLFPVLVVECWSKAREIRRLRSLPSVDAGEVARVVAEKMREEATVAENPLTQQYFVLWKHDSPETDERVTRRRLRSRRRLIRGIQNSKGASVRQQYRTAAAVPPQL